MLDEGVAVLEDGDFGDGEVGEEFLGDGGIGLLGGEMFQCSEAEEQSGGE
jgi:hypothetical protein